MTVSERLNETMDREPRLVRALLEVLPDFVFRLTRGGKFLDYIPARGMTTHVPEEQFLGRNLREVLPTIADAALVRADAAIDTGAEQSLDYELSEGGARRAFEARFVRCADDEVLVIVRDVTEKRETEEKLRQSEERFRTLVELAGDVILLVGPDGAILELNGEAERLYGRSRARVLGTSFLDLFEPGGDRKAMETEVARALEGEPRRGVVIALPSTRGESRLLSWNVERTVDESGAPTGIVACGRDVTEQQALEESVLEIAKGVSAATGERFFRHLAIRLAEILEADVVMVGALERAAGGERIRTVAVCEDGRLAKNLAYELRGSPCENVLGQKICTYPTGVALRFPRDRALTRKGIEGYVGAPLFDSAGRSLGLINVLYRREVPSVRLAESVLRIFATRAAAELERASAARELRASEELNARIVEAMPGGIVQAAANGSILVANAVAERVLELELDRKTRRYVARAPASVVREDGSACAEEETPLAACLRTGEAQSPRVLGLRRANRDVFWGVFTAIPLNAAGGALEGAVLMFTDITDRKNAEEERRSLEARVQHAQKLESLGVLAGGIAHDFNNLLTGILGNVGLAVAKLPEGSDVRPLLERVERAAERAAELTNQMLAYAGKGSFVVGPLSLNPLVVDLVPLLQSSVSKKATLDYGLDPELPDIEGDRSQIEQVVMNLITNASDALEGREGRILVRTGTVRVDEEGTGERERVFLEVSDTGSGMDEATRTRIFDPFFTTKFTGRGLGLAAVQGIVRGHGGSIRVTSRPRHGTRFTVLFPPATGARRSSVGLAWAASPAPGVGTVLVIDDEEAVRQFAAAALASVGYRVLEAADGREGLELFDRHRGEIVAVLLDASMPRMDGGEALARIKARSADVPVLVTSGYSEHDAVARSEGAGVDGFIQKPFRAEQLVERLHHLTGVRKA